MVSPPDAAKSASIAGQAASSLPAKTDGRPPGAAVPVPAADRADIRPLDLAGALQILISEVRAEMDSALLSLGMSTAGPPLVRADQPQTAVHGLVETLLDAYLQESRDFAAFNLALARIDTAWQSGSTRALQLVADWKEVPGAVVDSIREVIAGTVSLIDEKNVNPAFLRPEWLGLQPKLERYRRRRRRLNRWLTDPDFKGARLDDDSEPPR